MHGKHKIHHLKTHHQCQYQNQYYYSVCYSRDTLTPALSVHLNSYSQLYLCFAEKVYTALFTFVYSTTHFVQCTLCIIHCTTHIMQCTICITYKPDNNNAVKPLFIKLP